MNKEFALYVNDVIKRLENFKYEAEKTLNEHMDIFLKIKKMNFNDLEKLINNINCLNCNDKHYINDESFTVNSLLTIFDDYFNDFEILKERIFIFNAIIDILKNQKKGLWEMINDIKNEKKQIRSYFFCGDYCHQEVSRFFMTVNYFVQDALKVI